MRKITLILSLLVTMVSTAMAGDIVVSTQEGSPEKVFTIKSGNNVYVGADAAPGDGRFAFFAVENVENAYYIYSVTNNKWFSYKKAASYSTGKNFVTLSEVKENYFYFEKINNGYYQIRPYNNTDVAGKYLNYFGGASAGDKLGLWTDDGNTDGGSRYLIEEYEELVTVNTLSDFNPEKYYIVSTSSRGGWSVSETGGEFVSTSDGGLGLNVDKNNRRNQFAVLTLNNKDYYLFSVHANKFVKANCTTVEGVGDAIELTDAETKQGFEGSGRVRANFKGYTDKYINLGGSNQMAVNGWSDIDAGNAVLFIECDDFDPTEALEMLKPTVTYKFSYKGEVLEGDEYTQVTKVVPNAEYPDITVKFPYGIVEPTKPEGTVTENVEITIELKDFLPFVAADSYENINNWYYIQMHSSEGYGCYLQYAETYIEWADKEINSRANTYTWGFVGNPFEGFKLVNYVAPADANAVVSVGKDNPYFGSIEEATSWIYSVSRVNTENEYFCFKYPSEDGQYMNAQDGKVAHWGDNDQGSTMWVEERTVFNYESLDNPTFDKPGQTTKVAQVVFNNVNLTNFEYECGTTSRINNVPKVEAGKTYTLKVTYEMHWGDLAIYQIDKDGAEKTYGYYSCQWEPNGDNMAILRQNETIMCKELGISSLDELDLEESDGNNYLTIPYEVTINDNLEVGDQVVVRMMVGVKDKEGEVAKNTYNEKGITEGGCLDLVLEVKEAPLPETGKYYRLKSSYDTYVKDGLATQTDADASTIFYFEPGSASDKFYMLSYVSGKYMANPFNIGIGTDPVVNHENEIYKQEWQIKHSTSKDKYLLFYKNQHYMVVDGTGIKNGSADAPEALWTIEEVKSLPVTITEAGYATFYAPVAVTVPEGVTAHTVTINKDWATLSEIEGGVIPANTGVVLEATKDNYDFTITTAAEFDGVNALCGTVETAYIADDAYVLGYINVAEEGEDAQMEVGFYTALMTNGAWKNNSHKAYLPKAVNSNSASLRFGFGTTAIEEVETENAGAEVIFDLTGRRVNQITKAGVYIVNGKKTLVK